MSAISTWINGIAPASHSTTAIRLFSFPYAGGGASVYRLWVSELGPEIEAYPVQLPGREGRWHEPAVTRLSDLVAETAEALSPLLRAPFALFGHSMGAFIAFELARHLRRHGGPQPGALIVSAARAPHLPDPDPPLRHLSADQLVDHLKRLDGIPHELLEHPEFVSLLIPTLQADMTACETYSYEPEPPLSCPITVYGGEHDSKASKDQLTPWRYQTTGEFTFRMFPGDHFFFLKESRTAVLRAIQEELRRYCATDASNALCTSVEIERAITRIWGDILRVRHVGLDDNFFDLGGNSLLMIQAYGRLRQDTDMNLSVLDLFRYPTARLLATAIGATRPSLSPS